MTDEQNAAELLAVFQLLLILFLRFSQAVPRENLLCFSRGFELPTLRTALEKQLIPSARVALNFVPTKLGTFARFSRRNLLDEWERERRWDQRQSL